MMNGKGEERMPLWVMVAGSIAVIVLMMLLFFLFLRLAAKEDARIEELGRKLRNQAKLTTDIVDSVPVALSLRDPATGKYLFVNKTWEKWFGKLQGEVVGSRVQDRFPPEIAEEAMALDRKALDHGPGAPPEMADLQFGRHRYTQTRSVMADEQGNVVGLMVASIDTTERFAEQQQLRDQMLLTRTLIDDNPNAMYMKDKKGRYVQVNDAWLKMVGVTREQALGHTVLELFPERESQRYHAEDMRLIAQGEGSSEMESLRTGPGGMPQWVIVRKAVLRRANGDVIGLIGTNTDITKLKNYEAELADRNKFVTEVIEALPVSVALRDTEGRFVQVNRTWEQYFGVRREQAIGKRLDEIFTRDPDLLAFAVSGIKLDMEAIARGPDQPLDVVERHTRGRIYLNTRRALADTAGKVMGVIAVNMEVTEQRNMAEVLALEQRRLGLVVRATKAGIVDWDGQTHATYYSPRFREILGHSPDADTSQWPDYFKVLLHPEDRERFTTRWQTFIKGRGPDGPRAEFLGPDEHRLLRKDGTYVWVEVNGVAVRNDKGWVTRWIAATTDITDRRAQDEQLKQSVALREEVERMSRHDLKTPINSVIAVSRLLRENTRLAKEDAELLITVERAGYRILNMVNLSLDLFRMEQGIYDFRPQPVDLDEVAARVATDLQSQAASKNVRVEVKRTTAIVARAEEVLCYSIFANLVKNAIEAAPEGTLVTIELDRENGMAVTRIHNLGTVPEHVRPRFFEKYATAGKTAGLGLGTYSARLLAQAQGGEVTLRTSESEGTTLTVWLHQAAAEDAQPKRDAAAEAATAAPIELPALRVLVADDDEFNRLVLKRQLPAPLKVSVAVNGRAALDAAISEWPDVVLLDLEMPVMDGYETARRLREIERDKHRKRCLIVAVSSNEDDPIVRRALAAGCDKYLVKPAPRELLWQIIAGAHVPVVSGGTSPVEAQPTDEVLLDADLEPTLPGFIASRRAALDEMPAAIEGGDRAAVKRLAHRLAGSFALYGFRWASAHSKALERNAELGTPDELAAAVSALRTHLDNVRVRVAQRDAVTP